MTPRLILGPPREPQEIHILTISFDFKHEHSTEMDDNDEPICWCEPTLDFLDPYTHDRIWLHQEIH